MNGNIIVNTADEKNTVYRGRGNMENNAGVEPQNNSRKTLTIVLVSLLAAALVLGGVLIAL